MNKIYQKKAKLAEIYFIYRDILSAINARDQIAFETAIERLIITANELKHDT